MKKFNKNSLWYQLLKIFCVNPVFFRFYRHVETIGNIPQKGPFIFAISHQNSLMDALAVLCTQKHQILFVGRADIFAKKYIAKILHFFRLVPIFRKRDHSAIDANTSTFQILNDALSHNKVIGIMPEGRFNPTKTLLPLQKGIFRIAMKYMDSDKELQIVPVGVNWEDSKTFYKDVCIYYGEPISVGDYYTQYQSEPAKTMAQMSKDLTQKMLDILITEDERSKYKTNEDNWAKFTKKTLKNRGINLEEKRRNTLGNLLYLLFCVPIALVGFVIGIIPYLLGYKLQNTFKDEQFRIPIRFVITLVADLIIHLTLVILTFVFFKTNYVAIVISLLLIMESEHIWYEWFTRLKNTFNRTTK